MGITFLPGYREASQGIVPTAATVKQPPANNEPKVAAEASGSQVNGNGATTTMAEVDFDLLERAGIAMKIDPDDGSRDSQFARFQSDAPSCDNCGSITVRNGNCYLCHNCGNSMGCS
jgi:ribonucleoside-diphosphate reductase alpha chain